MAGKEKKWCSRLREPCLFGLLSRYYTLCRTRWIRYTLGQVRGGVQHVRRVIVEMVVGLGVGGWKSSSRPYTNGGSRPGTRITTFYPSCPTTTTTMCTITRVPSSGGVAHIQMRFEQEGHTHARPNKVITLRKPPPRPDRVAGSRTIINNNVNNNNVRSRYEENRVNNTRHGRAPVHGRKTTYRVYVQGVFLFFFMFFSLAPHLDDCFLGVKFLLVPNTSS